MEPVVRAPQMSHILEKFRHRSDKMNVRETFPLLDKVIERFSNGRKGGLISDSIFTLAPPSEIYIQSAHFQMKLILLCVLAELAVLGIAKTALKFKYEI